MQNTAFSAILFLVACASSAVAEISAKEASLNITAHAGTPGETEGVEQLRRLLEHYDLDRWINTNDVVIQSRVIPHSHPVLTLNTRYVGGGERAPDDHAQLSVFVHEQGHWYFTAHRDATFAAMEELGRLFPETPSPENGGARDRDSTLLHLMVCMLEYDAMVELVGRDRARELLGASEIYPWVYARILSDEDNARIRAVMATHRLNTY
jgi:hypothetical protein